MEGADMKVASLLLASFGLTLVCFQPAVGLDSGTTPTKSAAGDITPTTEIPSQSPWGWLKAPNITMPKLSFPKMPADPLSPIKTSAHKVSDGAKKAWEGTKEIFTFGGSTSEQPTVRTASAQEAPSLWERMFGPKAEPKPQPGTVAEFMKQPRVE
jgi:hypothetical protein